MTEILLATINDIIQSSSGVSSFNTRTGAVTLQASDVGAVSQIAAVSHQFLTSFGAGGAFTQAQPNFTDLAGSIAAGQIPASTLTYSMFQNVTAARLLGNPTGSAAAPSEISLGATLSFSGTALQTAAGTGDVTWSVNSFATTIAANAVTNAKLAQMGAKTIKGNNTGSTANATDLTAAQVTTLLALPGAFEFIIDGGGAVIPTGLWHAYFEVPYACTITMGTLLADESGSISIDVLKTSFANFDAGATHPVDADKISASAPLAISTSTKSQDGTLTGWTKSLSLGDIIGFNINSVTSIQRVTISLRVTRS